MYMMKFRIAFISLAQVFENYHCVCKICHIYFEFSMLYNKFRIMSNSAPHRTQLLHFGGTPCIIRIIDINLLQKIITIF